MLTSCACPGKVHKKLPAKALALAGKSPVKAHVT